jgi:hypothetical protein
MGRPSALLLALARLGCALMMSACGEPLFPADHSDALGLAYDPDGALLVMTTDALLFFGPDRRERARRDLGSGPWVGGLASNSALVVGWGELQGDGSALLIDRTVPEKPVRHLPDVDNAALAADGRLAVVRSGTRVGDPATDSWVELSPQRAFALVFSSDGKAVIAAFHAVGPPATTAAPAKVVSFDATTGAVLWNIPLDLRNLGLSSDGSTLVGVVEDLEPRLTLVFMSASDGVETGRVTVPGYDDVAFGGSLNVPLAVSRTGASVAVTVRDFAAKDWRTIVIRDGKIAYSVSALSSMAFSPDDSLLTGGAHAASPHEPAPLLFYDSATGAEVDRRVFSRPFF